LTDTDEDREKNTLPHTNDGVRIQRTASSRNAKQPPAAHNQERTDREIGIELQQTAAIRQTLTRNIGIQQTSTVASVDDHQTKQSEINAANEMAQAKIITNNADIGAVASFVSTGDRTVDTSSLSEDPRSDVAEHIPELFQKKNL